MQPPQNLEYIADFVPNADEIFWDLMAELYDAQDLITLEHPGHRRLYASMYRRASAVDLTRIFKMQSEDLGKARRGGQYFPPTVGILAGAVHQHFGRLPDMAVVQLYRDGTDLCAYHADGEIMCGPEPGNALVPILSFGAQRSLRVRPMGPEADEDVPQWDYSLEPGSMVVMSGTMQRRYLHSIPADPLCKQPRISVTFLFAQPVDGRDQMPWVLLRSADDEGDGGLTCPLFVAAAEEVLAQWEDWGSSHGSLCVVDPQGNMFRSARSLRMRIAPEDEVSAKANQSPVMAEPFNDGLQHLLTQGMLPPPQDIDLSCLPQEWLTGLSDALMEEFRRRNDVLENEVRAIQEEIDEDRADG